MNSGDLIKGSKERFKELQEERASFEEVIEEIINHWMREIEIISQMSDNLDKDAIYRERLKKGLSYQLQQTKSLHWRSFYLGWVEGRSHLNIELHE